jgi:hypothetical protein
MDIRKLGYDTDQIINAFQLEVGGDCQHLNDWLDATYPLDAAEQLIVNRLFEDMREAGDYFNEEELKIRFVGGAFLVAKVDVAKKVRVFYERPLAAEVEGHKLSVVCDCLVATPFGINSPQNPYFFLQEFKKGKGEKNDPEGQMLVAMLIAQKLNADQKPLYGGYLVGADWRFATLIGRSYCTSKKYDAAQKDEIEQIVFILRRLRELILHR